MNQATITLNTKKMLAASLKKFMELKPLSKITINDIICDCDLNRKTFYYHFEDIYALLKWMLEQEVVEVVKQFDLLTEYADAIEFVMNYVEANKHILNCAYDSMGRDEMKRFFCADFMDVVTNIVNHTEIELKVRVDKNFKIFLVDFYTEALAGVMINAFQSKRPVDKQMILNNVSLICRESIPNILLAKAE